MLTDELVAAASRWAAEDVAALPTATLGADLIALRGVVNRLEAEFTRRLAIFDARGGAAADGLPTGAWLRHRCRLSPSDAAVRLAAARRLSQFPRLAAAFAAGEVSAEHVRAVTTVRDDATRGAVASVEDTLTQAARSATPVELRRLVGRVVHAAAPEIAAAVAGRQFERRWLSLSQTFDGAWAVDGLLDPESGATVRAALDAVMAGDRRPGDTRPAAQARADALAILARHALDTGRLPIVAGERPHLVVHVPAHVLTNDRRRDLAGPDGRTNASQPDGMRDPAGRGADKAAGIAPARPTPAGTTPAGTTPTGTTPAGTAAVGTTPAAETAAPGHAALPGTAATIGVGRAAPTLTRDAVLRLGCDAKLTRLLLDADSLPLDIGRATRVVPPHLRRALEARDQGCAWPGCDRPPQWTDAHHVVHWIDGGATSLDNLMLLCRRHHHAVHEERATCPRPQHGSADARAGPPEAA